MSLLQLFNYMLFRVYFLFTVLLLFLALVTSDSFATLDCSPRRLLLSMGFWCRLLGKWVTLHFYSPRDLPDSAIEPFFTLGHREAQFLN